MAKTKKNAQPKTERRTAKDRRTESDRRTKDVPVADDARTGARRSKVQRRRQIDPTTCERDYSADEIEFMHALDAYKRSSGRMFPTCSEILEVIRALGYERVVPPLAEPSGENDASGATDESGETDVFGDANTSGETIIQETAEVPGSHGMPSADLEELNE